jgi:anaerobic selenocysteine-containing dehydrogenase
MAEKPIGADQYPLFYSLWGRVSPYGIATLFPQAALESKPYPVRGAIVAAANPANTFPEANKFIEAFKSMDFVMAMDIFMNDSTELADLVLPACTFMEKDALSYVYGVVHGEPFASYHRKVIDPIGESKPDWWIWTQLAHRLGFGELFPWKSDEEVIDMLMAPSGIGDELKANELGMYFGKQDYYAYKNKKINTPSGKIEIYSKTLEDAGYDPLPKYLEPAQSPVSTPELAKEFPLIMISGARRKEFTHTQMRHVPQLRSLAPEPFAEIHPATCGKYGVRDGERIRLSTRNGSIKLRVKEQPRLMPGVVAVPHGWPGESNVNLLTDMKVRDPITGYPDFKALLCKVEAV